MTRAWYIREAFTFGPLRLNLSKSGFGICDDVIKGARVGVDAKAGPTSPAGASGSTSGST